MAVSQFSISALYAQVALAVACQTPPNPSVDRDDEFVGDADDQTVG
jgi:hypothetical protein